MTSRPSLTFSRTRAAAAKAAEEDESSLSAAMAFRRRFPKIGSQFQAKVPKKPLTTEYETDRPAPMKMSGAMPEMTTEEASCEALREALSAGITASSSSSSNSVGLVSLSGTGLRDPHARNPQPIVLPSVGGGENAFATHNNTVEETTELQQWITSLVDWHDAVEKAQLTAPVRSRKSRFKRPREAPAIPTAITSAKVRALDSLHEDGDKQNHVPAEQLKWRLLVDLGAGQAIKRIREQRKRKRKGATPNNHVPLWRAVCQRPAVSVRGDCHIRATSVNTSTTGASASLGLQRTWKAVLACAKAYGKRIREGPALPLSEALSLCENASKLVAPEHVWENGEAIIDEINSSLNTLGEGVEGARTLRAQWMDLWHKEGVDLEVLRKALRKGEAINLQPDELPELNRQVGMVGEWQNRVDAVKTSPRSSQNDLQDLENLCCEAQQTHAVRSKVLLALECRLEKAHELREKIRGWKRPLPHQSPDEAPALESLKFLSALVREISRLKLKFPEAALVLEISESTEAWVERANIAIRSRISLSEIRSLIDRGEKTPIDLTEYLDKLRLRESKAQEWLNSLRVHVDLPDNPDSVSTLGWMSLVRTKLGEGGQLVGTIHDLTCEGSRIPVEMDCVKLLQIELDARHWSCKARNWIPGCGDDSRKGKIDEIREHIEKAAALRGRLTLSAEDRAKWQLDGEDALTVMLRRVDDWFAQYREFLEVDSRRGPKRQVSMSVLRKIVDEANSIHLNLGPSSAKMAKILSQAEEWHKRWESTLAICQQSSPDGNKVLLSDIKEAVKDADATIGVLDLKEANDMQLLVDRVDAWFDRASAAVDGKKKSRRQHNSFTVDDVTDLIQQGRVLPVETTAEVTELESTMHSITEWRARALRDIGSVAVGFQQLKKAVDSKYGEPKAFSLVQDERRGTDEGAAPTADQDALGLSSDVEALIKGMCQEAKSSCVVTDEGAVALQLEEVLRWTSRSVKYLENQREMFDSRFFGAFDRFLSEGKNLQDNTSVEEDGPIREISRCWRLVLEDQLERMTVLLKERGEFVSWCKKADDVLSGNEKKLTAEKLREIVRQSLRFPPEHDTVARVKELSTKSDDWLSRASGALGATEKMPLHEAKALMEEGSRLGVQSNELRALRNAVKAARAWANKVKRVKPDEGQPQAGIVKTLLDEYESLVLTLPEEHKRLSRAMKNYCICRRPFEGIMIKCDKCEDWFHKACVGISQARAEKKMDKYICVRCLVGKVFHCSNTTIAGVLRKWTNDADLKKARMSDAQKHQRKIRKETKELEKLRGEAEQITQALAKQPVAGGTAEARVGPEGAGQNTAVAASVGQAGSAETPVSAENAKPTPEPTSQEDMGKKIEKVTAAIKQCQGKLQELADAAVLKRNEEEIENMRAEVLKRWCVRVRSLVLAPDSEERALVSRPSTNGMLSPPMVTVIQDAERQGLMRYADVQTVVNAFKCLCWSSQAMQMLAKRPRASDAVTSVRQASALKLPEEKGLRMIKSMAQRATAWNYKASRLLMPDPNEKRPFDMRELRNLSVLADDIPLRMPLEPRVQAVIDDAGARHCICGGPSDGRLMLSCDKCEHWFHAHCVGVTKDQVEQIGEWKCPPCRGLPSIVSQDLLRGFHDAFGREEEDESSNGEDDDTSSKAPLTEKLWPPFGLNGCQRSIEALGQPLCSYPADCEAWHCAVVNNRVRPQPEQHAKLPVTHTRTVTRQLPGLGHVVCHEVAPQPRAPAVAAAARVAPGPAAAAVVLPPTQTQKQPEAGVADSKPEDQPDQKQPASPMVAVRQPQPSVNNASADGLPVTQLLAMRDVMVAPVQDNS